MAIKHPTKAKERKQLAPLNLVHHHGVTLSKVYSNDVKYLHSIVSNSANLKKDNMDMNPFMPFFDNAETNVEQLDDANLILTQKGKLSSVQILNFDIYDLVLQETERKGEE
ncbi:unnamed protein product [Sphenostylis stenocarpa]|uniref:Uncharacterized protein n=1 Tax=Sphenostylis stenocarpa TaxID=92480 RepID=A0AA86VNZ2_9FABA|nr:unnamed protein product [Sphenostylis stenocarpa]